MRPDQLVASLEGLAAVRAVTAPALSYTYHVDDVGGRRRWSTRRQRRPAHLPPLSAGWRDAALAASRAALPQMAVAEVGRFLLVSGKGLEPNWAREPM